MPPMLFGLKMLKNMKKWPKMIKFKVDHWPKLRKAKFGNGDEKIRS